MSEKRFERWNDHSCKVKDNQEDTLLNWEDVVKELNEQQSIIHKDEISIKTMMSNMEKLEKENEQLRQFINKGRRLSVKELMANTNENELLKKKIRGLEKENDDLRTTITKQVGAITEMKDLLYMFADLRIFDYSSEIEEDMQELKKAYDGTLEDFLKYFKED